MLVWLTQNYKTLHVNIYMNKCVRTYLIRQEDRTLFLIGPHKAMASMRKVSDVFCIKSSVFIFVILPEDTIAHAKLIDSAWCIHSISAVEVTQTHIGRQCLTLQSRDWCISRAYAVIWYLMNKSRAGVWRAMYWSSQDITLTCFTAVRQTHVTYTNYFVIDKINTQPSNRDKMCTCYVLKGKITNLISCGVCKGYTSHSDVNICMTSTHLS